MNNYLESDENPQQLISDIDPRLESNIYNLSLKAMLLDQQPIRTACFSPNGNFIALGTNSKSLKICALPHLALDDEEDEQNLDIEYFGSPNSEKGIQKLQVLC